MLTQQDEVEAPRLSLAWTEIPRAIGEYGMFQAMIPLLPLLPRGDGHPVLVFPGFAADDFATRTLRGVLRQLGYRTHGWGLGRNIGPTATCLEGMSTRLQELNERYDRPVSLVGWSLGGIFARDLARELPDAVRQVITLGSPIRMAHSSQSNAHHMYQRYVHLHAKQPVLPLEHDAPPLPVPSTAIYSRDDGVVAWQICMAVPGERSENIAVHSSHCGITHHPAVIYAVANRLAQPASSWAPFRPPVELAAAFPKPDAP